MKQLVIKLIYTLVILLSSILSTICFAENKPLDIRILIDLSSSMSDNDPRNLRSSAIKIVSKILPQGAMAGVWGFEHYSQELIPFGPVNYNWVSQANNIHSLIHSEGGYTNIGEAIENSTVHWTESDLHVNRHLVIMTDGVVDVSDDHWENQEARAHIIDTILPHLKRVGVKVHTISLSPNADNKLLKQLSETTEGLYKMIQSSRQIQKVFMQIFDQTVKPLSLPIKGNDFVIDKSIDEITLLLFKQKPDEEVKIRDPHKKMYNKNQYPDNLQWFDDGFVELVTIMKPTKGTWTIIGNKDSDSRAIILSDINLDYADIPTNIFAGETVTLKANLTDKGKTVIKEGLLRHIEFMVHSDIDGRKNINPLIRNQGDTTGNFMADLNLYSDSRMLQEVKLEIVARGRTFQRQKQLMLNLLPLPLEINIATDIDQNRRRYVNFMVKPDTNVVVADTLMISATTKDNNKQEDNYRLLRKNDDTWQLSVSPADTVSTYEASFKVKGRTISGRNFDIVTRPILVLVPEISFPEEKQPVPKVEEKPSEPKPEVKLPPKPNPKVVKKTKKPIIKQPSKKMGWIKITLLSILVVLVNALLAVLGFVLYRHIKKRQENSIDNVVSEIGE